MVFRMTSRKLTLFCLASLLAAVLLFTSVSLLDMAASAQAAPGLLWSETWTSSSSLRSHNTLHPLPVDAPLEKRLQAWAKVPVAGAADWHVHNLQTCPPSQNHDIQLSGYVKSMTRSETGGWGQYWRNSTRVSEMRAELIGHLERVHEEGRLSALHSGQGRGIVFAAGNLDTFERTAVSVRLLRNHYGSTLPVEIFSFEGETPSPEFEYDMEELDAVLRTVPLEPTRIEKKKNYHLKATALLQSSFREIVFMDSDNYPAADLTPLFGGKAYQRLGAAFWPDFWKESPVNPIWQLIGVQCRDEYSQEAGIMLIDKSRHLDVLNLVEFMLHNHEEYYNFSDGDKDLFRFAMLALRKRWAVPGRHLASASWDEEERQTPFCGHTMVQHDFDGRPISVHGNMLKKLPSYYMFRPNREVLPEPIWGHSKIISRSTLDEYDLDADALANIDLDTGHGITKHQKQDVALRNFADAGARPYWYMDNRHATCLSYKFDVPGNEDTRIPLEQQSQVRGVSLEDLVPLLGKQKPLVDALWRDDERLRYFEARFRSEGGRASGRGFL